MATYDSDTTTVGTALQDNNPAVFTDDTISRILALTTTDNSTVSFETTTPDANGNVTVASGAEVVIIYMSDTQQTTITPPQNAPVVIFQGLGGVSSTFSNGIDDRIVIGSDGSDNLVFTGSNSNYIVLGGGTDTVIAGLGDDTIVAGLGNSTIDGGGGTDIVWTDWTHILDAARIVSADAAGQAPQASTTDHVIITNSDTGQTIDLTGVQYVQLANDDAVIVAASTVEAGVASLYHAAFGRTGEAGGVEFWFDYAKAGLSLHDIAVGFTQSAEFAASAALSNHDFITQLYTNTFGRAPDTGGLAYWTQQLANGATRADLLTQFATVAALNEQGVIHTEATVVGTVIIEPHIV